jgi:ketosteroid isomerase-like protein
MTPLLAILAQLFPPALNEMVETERAFAAMGAEKGVRVSFFEYFGEEGIAFVPHPMKLREFARANPLPDPPPAEYRLEWWPVYGDVAESGDLGYNTGPSLRTDVTGQNRPSRHGFFFSVWRKDPGGKWRVAVDMGTETPGPDPAHQDRLRYERAPQAPSKTGGGARQAEMLLLESRFGADARRGMRQAYAGAISDHARLHRANLFPIEGRTAIDEYLAARDLTILSWEGIDGGVAASGELGYAYGRYELGSGEKGYFTHVWKRNAEGEWTLVADVTNALN